MKPMFKYGLVAGALALPALAYPLGLGRLTVDSYVGQPLSARIELLSATKEELDSLSARIADAALYQQNNLQYQGVLARSRVSIERGPNDTAYLRVVSTAPVTEPYLDLLVEVNWASGRVVRDYTFLLDPPGTQVASTAEPTTPLRQGAAPAPRVQPTPSTQAPVAAAAPPAPRAAGDQYEVKRGDTLSKIAKDYKPETVTLDQMLVALFKSNASAFEGNNMNRLRTGAIITIPNAAQATTEAGNAQEATRTVQVQASDWRAYRDRVAAAAPTAGEGTTRETGGRIGTAVQERTPAARPGSDQLRVSRADASGGGGAAAAETAASQAAALREAQSRIAELEKMVADLRRANELRSGTMAQLQTQAEKGKAPAPPPPPTPITSAAPPKPAAAEPPKPAVVEPPKPAAVEPPKPAVVEPPKPTAVEPPKPAVVEPPKPTAVEPPKPAVVEPPKPAATEPPKVAEAPKPPPKPAPKPAAKEPPGFFEDLLGGTPLWAIGVGALALIGAIVALFAARRRKTTKFEDSIISGTDIKTNTVFGSTGGGVVNTGDNSLASDFSREGLGNIDTDEVDPIAEAEVYLAYGRDAQAEEILKDALKKDPQRQEIYLKLLEIHAQHNKPSAFETVASELYAVTSGQGDVWQKAVGLGRQLDPSNPMFAEGGAPAPRPAVAAAAAAAASAVEMREESLEIDKGDGVEFHMDEEISISPTSGAKPKSPADILAGAELELDRTARLSAAEFDPDKTQALPSSALAAVKPALETAQAHLQEKMESVKDKAAEKFDLDFRLDDIDKPAPLGKPRIEPVLEAAGVGAPVGPAAAPAQLARPAAALELDKLDLSFDPERSTFEDPTPSVLDGQWHDAATKLDLAKAYQEMGDVEGAREILQEVLHEGDDQQKAEAKSLLAKLG
ncbi:MAG: FimV family protein [Burkholderiales bacterium]|nr:FimV family protein [Burkholderiales bacterium]